MINNFMDKKCRLGYHFKNQLLFGFVGKNTNNISKYDKTDEKNVNFDKESLRKTSFAIMVIHKNAYIVFHIDHEDHFLKPSG